MLCFVPSLLALELLSSGCCYLQPAWWYNPVSKVLSNLNYRYPISNLHKSLLQTSSTTSQSPFSATNNCKEILDKRLQVRWEIQGDQVQITLSARLRKEQYMAFGISGAEGRPAMLGADVVVAYWDTRVNQPRVADYSISHLAQCDGERGVCPDQRIGGTNDVQLVSGNQKNGITTITYRRPLAAKESVRDKEILTSRSQSVIAAFGPLNSRYEANAHSFMDTTRNDNENTCIGLAETDSSGPAPWPARVISGVTNFTARIGPAAGARGYTALTGHPSWGIAWYINDQLIPEIYVERGKTYTFFVEGGDDRTNPAKDIVLLKLYMIYVKAEVNANKMCHLKFKTAPDNANIKVTKTLRKLNETKKMGRYCEWTHKTIDQSAASETFEDYMKTVQLECNDGEPAVLNWTVAHETPDLVYYQCYTHNNLGWKIHVVDPGTAVPVAGEKHARVNGGALSAAAAALAPLVLAAATHLANWLR
ncbi:hypothetical protein HF086_002776 [Spodoptera exigua]|uniref:DOMON domain-containing protein n=1 Tax=Spodoptera exigua TaxID=7107 RepID=A0A922MA74_SPOEX|nr:hypothetical protein HF086_002776 [Spodoptera exigua]